MCSVGVRWTPGEPTWLTLLGVRDELADRPFDDPGPYWPGLVGGRDRLGGGTWFAVDPAAPAVSILVNGPPPEGGPPPAGVARAGVLSRGVLPIADLTGADVGGDTGGDTGGDLSHFGNFYLVHIDRDSFTVRSHVPGDAGVVALGPGVHTIRPSGVDEQTWPSTGLGELLASAGDFDAMATWLAAQPVDESGGFGQHTSVLINVEVPEQPHRHFASVCAQMLRFGDGVRFDFTRTPRDLTSWRSVISA